MIDSYPLVTEFTRLYLNQTGIEIYGSVGNAFEEMLRHAERLPDSGDQFKRTILEEIFNLERSFDEVARHRVHGKSIKFKYAYLFSDDIEELKTILLKRMSSTDS
ncbi:MAG TPA: hypothetical protein VFK50_03980 [Sphingomicrobium sp.]|nr:hypothetical protein [Sphingomicrobium sp.]